MTPPIVKRYLIAFEKYKWIGLGSFALVVAGSTVVALQPEPSPSYIASGALAYSRPPVSFSATGTEIQQQGQELNEDILLSNQVIETVAAKVNVPPKKIVENLSITIPEKPKNADAKTGGGSLSAAFIELKYKDTERSRSQETLQDLMQTMIKLSDDINTRRLKTIIQKISERLPAAKKELQAAEQKLEKYDRTERPAILAAENGSLLSAVTGSQVQQRQIKLTLAGIDAQIRSLQEKLGLNVNQAYASSALSADPILASLRTQIYQVESQMEVLRKDLRPDHPTMIQLQRQKDAYERLLRERGVEVVGGEDGTAPLPGTVKSIRARSNLDPARQQLANQMVALQTQQQTLQHQLVDLERDEARLRREYSQIPNKQLERSRLEQQVLLKKNLYDQIQAKLTDAKTAETETVSSLSVARSSTILPNTKKPKNMFITLGVGGFLGLLVGAGVIFLLGSLEGTFKTREDIRDSLKQREVALLGEIPLIPLDSLDKEAIPVVLSVDSPYLEYYEKFRSNLRRIGGNTLKVVLITSTSSSEGKTASAYNLGIASARAGKRTLIIETDLRSPSHASYLNVTPEQDTAIEPLRYYGSLSECIRLVPDVENLYIIPSPGPVRQSAAILESSELRRLMEDVRERYDLVILDTTALSLSNDPLLVQPYADGIVLTTRPNYTQENLLAEVIDQLVESELGLLGAIINGADIDVPVPHHTEPISDFPPEEEELSARARRS
ncbi:AAA family ATPase [Aetokthonos hydrillicola Thurmond2011]|jgi:capsular exopolysaccharide synthesis family protein|uniref:AAA family ATPase n=1 Tax=Aetokthonos hydrillicola Thurmond2011 TaxID=2712845 RepID=A0AAP5IBQ0_9CYAN|nr:tyrosine-protein kinase domain-containing protein [Aetokthonos hydrillicola]MBO3462362.1 AAA family ATPase [Aetokthonos hydrillicola CCALA 1050]MBW4584221.1 AAA family ATPase [Aetokthonos hydrillicola CCALA 1050]MDR9898571.1 AAA family ATPase [Aetokthonos hydrillicola Thurmond2011]